MVKRFKKPKKLIKRIAITGPESTGKSTLSEKVAKHFKTIWVPEYARNYVGSLNRPYNFNDVEKIAKIQLQQEDALLKKTNRIIFTDTELIVIKIWMEYKFNTVPEWVEKEISNRKYDLYLLCDIDLEWKYDPQREHPHKREYFFNYFKKELENRGFNYKIISGNSQQRMKTATNAVEKLLNE